MGEKIIHEVKIGEGRSTAEVGFDLPPGRYRITLEPIEPELEPCPFCGSEAEVVDNHATPGVKCTGLCGARLWGSSAISAVELWNRREFPTVKIDFEQSLDDAVQKIADEMMEDIKCRGIVGKL